jgi:glycine/D-amino acid oxidase-like deaminating enzyme
MTDLDRIEAFVGPLPKGREYARLTIGDKTIDWNDKADAALAEAYAVIERQAEENTGWKRSHDVWCDDLANIDSLKQRAEKAEAKARRWEWVATHQLLATGPHGQEELQDRVPSVVTDLAARYEEEHHD